MSDTDLDLRRRSGTW